MLAKRILLRNPVLTTPFSINNCHNEVVPPTTTALLSQNYTQRRCLTTSKPTPTKVTSHKRSFHSQGPFSFTLSLQQGSDISRISARWKSDGSCWNCSAEVPSDETEEGLIIVCQACGVLQKGSGNYFSLLGMKRNTYRVDVTALSMSVKGLQRKLHPDLFAQRGKEEQETSEELSSLVNKAYATLANPIERGRYLLRLKGVDDPEGDAEKTLTNDPNFLEEVMELNEQLEELQNEGEWREFRRRNRETFKELQMKLEAAFDKEDTKEAQILLGRLKYYDTLDGKLKDAKTRLGIVE